MIKKYQGKLFCFSPPVMVATFVIEILFALYALWRYRMSLLVRLAVLMLVLLATFQLAEYLICGGFGMSGLDWSRVGFVAITLLPPLGLHITHELAGKTSTFLLIAGYGSAIVFAGYFIFGLDVFVANLCQGNYVIFGLNATATALYSVYYYGWLLLSLGLTIYFARFAKDKKQRTALWAFAVGTAMFLLPTTTVNLLLPETLSGIPSIMCGLAVILAFIVSFVVLPKVAKQRL